MNVIHGAWIPKDTQDFIQSGDFYLWVESDEFLNTASITLHPQHLPKNPCLEFLKNDLALSPLDAGQGDLLSLLLPTFAGKPLPSPELQYSDIDDTVTLESWQVFAYPLSSPLKAINNIHFLGCFQATNSRIGSDFLFWYYFSQSLKQILAKDHYIPLLVSKKAGEKVELYRRWQVVSSNYESLIQAAITQMPLVCSQQHQPESLLRHFAEVVIDELLTAAALEMPQIFTKKIQGDFLETILLHKHSAESMAICQQLPDDFIHWQQWQQKLLGTQAGFLPWA